MNPRLAGLLALLALLPQILSARPAAEPSFEGRPLSSWLTDFTNDMVMGSNEYVRPFNAIKNLGTNAIPALLKMIASHDGGQCEMAAEGFTALAEDAKPAIPALLRLQKKTSFYPARCALVRAWGAIGSAGGREIEAAIPFLIREALDTVSVYRGNAVFALGKIAAQPKRVVPVLIKCLHDLPTSSDIHDVQSSAGTRLNAAHALGAFGSEAIQAVPDLIALTKDQTRIGPQHTVGESALEALYKIGPATAERIQLETK